MLDIPFPERELQRLSSGEAAALYIRRLIFEGRLRPGERVRWNRVKPHTAENFLVRFLVA